MPLFKFIKISLFMGFEPPPHLKLNFFNNFRKTNRNETLPLYHNWIGISWQNVGALMTSLCYYDVKAIVLPPLKMRKIGPSVKFFHAHNFCSSLVSNSTCQIFLGHCFVPNAWHIYFTGDDGSSQYNAGDNGSCQYIAGDDGSCQSNPGDDGTGQCNAGVESFG